MPSRPVAVLIVAFWLASTGWLLYREWWPWLRADSPPPFTVELADEAAPQLAHWSIWRGDQRIGAANTRMVIQKDDTFELTSTIENLTLSILNIEAKASRMVTVQRVNRKGELLAFSSNMRMSMNAFGLSPEMKTKIEGTVRDGKLHAQTSLEIDGAQFLDQPIDPIPLQSGSLLNPLQPVARLHARPGQHWKITHVDPFMEAFKASLRKMDQERKLGGIITRLVDKISGPTVVLAEVLDETKTLTYQDKPTECYVIEYKSKDFNGRTWVRVSDGNVLLQEVSGNGENVSLRRED